MTRQRTVERSTLVSERVPLIAETMPHIAHPAIRNRGTIGGSLAHADPAAELPAVMLALNAQPDGAQPVEARARSLAEEFFVGLFSTAVQPGELLTEIRIPPPPATERLSRSRRFRGGTAISRWSAWLRPCSSTTTAVATQARIALLSVGDRPMLAEQAAKALMGQAPSPESIRAAADAASTRDIDPSSDIHASARYRRQLANVLTRRVLERAFERATLKRD